MHKGLASWFTRSESRRPSASKINAERRHSVTYCSPFAWLDVGDWRVVPLAVAGGLDAAVVRWGVGREVTLGSLKLSSGLWGVEVDLGSFHAGTSHGVSVQVSGTCSIGITARDSNRWGLEGDLGRVDLHLSALGTDTNGRSVHASGTTVSASGKLGAVDIEIFFGTLGLESTLRTVGVEVNRWLLVLEGSVLIVAWAGVAIA